MRALLSNITYLGMHGFVYMVVNKKIRGEVLKLFGLKGRIAAINSVEVLTVARGMLPKKCID